MKGALLLASEDDSFSKLAHAMSRVGIPVGQEAPDYLRLTDAENRSLYLFDEADQSYMDEFRREPSVWEAGIQQFDKEEVTGAVVECRWDDMVIDVVGKSARILDFPVWVADGNRHIWDARAIDSGRLQL